MGFETTPTRYNEETGQWEKVKDFQEPVVPEPVIEPEESVSRRGRGRPRNGFDRRKYMRSYMIRKRTGTGSKGAGNVQECAGPVTQSNVYVQDQSMSV